MLTTRVCRASPTANAGSDWNSLVTWYGTAACRLLERGDVRCSIWLVLVFGCDLGTVETDEFWDSTTEDDESDDAVVAAGMTRRVAITAGKTQNAERIELLPVGGNESGAPRRIALQLRPDELPRLAKGDRLIVPAELQVTTRCDIGQNAPGCGYNPNVRAQLILTGSATDTSGTGNSKVIATQTASCTKNEHHCMFVFRPSDASIGLDATMPCMASGGCYINLVVWAWHPDARSGGQDKLLIGGNDGDFLLNGDVEPDLARIMAIRERGVAGGNRAARETTGSGTKDINTNANAELVYSHRLKQGPLKKGEQFVVEARLVADVSSRARFSTEMFVTRDGDATDGGGVEKVAPSAIGEQNGFNCSNGAPCVTRKVAVFRVTDDVADALFVNVAVKSAVPGGGSARVTVKRGDGWVRSVRYAAALADP